MTDEQAIVVGENNNAVDIAKVDSEVLNQEGEEKKPVSFQKKISLKIPQKKPEVAPVADLINTMENKPVIESRDVKSSDIGKIDDIAAIEFVIQDSPQAAAQAEDQQLDLMAEKPHHNRRNNNRNNNNHHRNNHSNNNANNEDDNRGEDAYLDEQQINFAYPADPEASIIVKRLKEERVPNLLKMAEEYGVLNYHRMLKQDLITSILKQAAFKGKLIYSEGILEIGHDGNGFLRSQSENYVPCSDDVFISNNQVRKFGLRFGDLIGGYARAPKKGERYFSLLRLMEINNTKAEDVSTKVNFENLTPLYPRERLNLEMASGRKDCSTRVIDLISPIGKGQRALIVAPPKSGKTVMMQNIAHAINDNHPEVYLMYLGIDERPEEFTEMQRTIKGEVVSSTFDEPSSRHVALAEIVIEKAKRLVEQGRDVVILLDSITRLARAYNNVVPSSGKILSGGVDSNALHKPKRFFGAARNIENGGSLTIIATALVDTGSKMDEVIFEEFKGTGNSEIVLDRKIADRRVFPAIDVLKSGTRKEEEMVDEDVLTKMWMLRRVLGGMGASHEALEFLVKKIKETKNNVEFFSKMNTLG